MFGTAPVQQHRFDADVGPQRVQQISSARTGVHQSSLAPGEWRDARPIGSAPPSNSLNHQSNWETVHNPFLSGKQAHVTPPGSFAISPDGQHTAPVMVQLSRETGATPSSPFSSHHTRPGDVASDHGDPQDSHQHWPEVQPSNAQDWQIQSSQQPLLGHPVQAHPTQTDPFDNRPAYYKRTDRLREPDSHVPIMLGSGFFQGMDNYPELLALVQEALQDFSHEWFHEVQDSDKVVKEKSLPKSPICDWMSRNLGIGELTKEQEAKSKLDSEIKRLYKRRAACGKLLDGMEDVVVHINGFIDKQKGRKQKLQEQQQRVATSIGTSTGFMSQCPPLKMLQQCYGNNGCCSNGCCSDEGRKECRDGFMSCCSNALDVCHDHEDIGHRVSPHQAGQIELRRDLREQLEEVALSKQELERELRERIRELEQELRELKQNRREGDLATDASAKAAMKVSAKEAKEKLLRHHASQWVAALGRDKERVFFGWRQLLQDKQARDKARKLVGRRFMESVENEKRVALSMCFASWVAEYREAVNKKHAKNDHVMKAYALKFLKENNAATTQAMFNEWLKVVQDSKVQGRLDYAQQQADEKAKELMEARYRALARHTVQNQRVVAMVSILNGRGLTSKEHSLYCECEVPGKVGKDAIKIHSQTMKSIRSLNAEGYEVKWNLASQTLQGFEVTDDLRFTVKIEGGFLHSAETLGTVTLKPSQIFPHGFQKAWLTLSSDKPAGKVKKHARAEPVPEIEVEVELHIENIKTTVETADRVGTSNLPPGPSPPLNDDATDHAKKAAETAEKAEKLAQRALDRAEEAAKHKPPNCAVHCTIA